MANELDGGRDLLFVIRQRLNGVHAGADGGHRPLVTTLKTGVDELLRFAQRHIAAALVNEIVVDHQNGFASKALFDQSRLGSSSGGFDTRHCRLDDVEIRDPLRLAVFPYLEII